MLDRIRLVRAMPLAASLLVRVGVAGVLALAVRGDTAHVPALLGRSSLRPAPPRHHGDRLGARSAPGGGDAAGRGIVVWQDSTAVRRRILLRSIGEGGRSLGPFRTLSQAIEAWAPEVAVLADGFLVAWHEERFPAIRTVVRRITAEEVRQ